MAVIAVTLTLLFALVISAHGFDVKLDVTSSWKCDPTSNKKYDFLVGHNMTITCNYGLPRDGVNKVQVYKGKFIVFDYEKGIGAFIRSNLEGRSSSMFTNTGVVLTVDKIIEEDDSESIKCFVNEDSASVSFALGEKIEHLPTKAHLSSLLHLPDDVKNGLVLNPGFKEAEIKVSVDNVEDLCRPLVKWKHGTEVEPCPLVNTYFVCIIGESGKEPGREYVYEFYLEEYGVESDSVSLTVKYQSESDSIGTTMLIVIIAVVVLVLIAIAVAIIFVFRKKVFERRATRGSSYSSAAAEPANL